MSSDHSTEHKLGPEQPIRRWSLAYFAVTRFQFTLVIFALMIGLGLYAFQRIPRAEDPTFPIPVVTVVAVYPGADPIDMESLVADPIEDAIAELDDVKTIWSSVSDGLSVTRVEFSWAVPAEKKYDEAIRELNALRSRLPASLSEFRIIKANPNNVNIVQVAITSETATAAELRAAAEDLTDQLKTLPGVKKAEFWGLPQLEVQVSVDPVRMRSAKVSIQRLIDAIRAENTSIPGGAISTETNRFTLLTSGDYESLSEIEDTIVAGAQGAVVRLKDVATVSFVNGEVDRIARFNGQRAVFIAANQKEGQNIFKVDSEIKRSMQIFANDLPASMRLQYGFEQSKNVAHRLNSLGIDFVIAISLVLITLLPLGLRAAGVVMVSIPLSLAGGLTAMYFMGFTLNQLSIAGFVIALGLLVDDSIVVVENIERHLRAGKSRIQAAIQGTQQIGMAVLGCTATLIFAFLPLLFLPEGAGKFVRNIPASVLVTVLASLFVSLTIIPFLASRALKPHADPQGGKVLQWVMGAIHRFYTPLLHRALAAPKTTLLISFVLFLSTLALVPLIGRSLFPLADVPQFLVTIETPQGSSLEETDRALRFVEQTLLENPEFKPYIKHVFGNLGRGNRQIFYNVFPREQDAAYAEAFVEVKQYDPKQTPRMHERLREVLNGYAGAQIVVKSFENGAPVDAPLAFRITGPDLDTLTRLSRDMEHAMSSTAGVRDIHNPLKRQRIDLDLNIDSQKAGLLGVTSVEIDRAVRMGVAGLTVSQFRDAEGDEFPINLRLPLQGGYPRLDLLEQVEVTSLSGNSIPLKQFISPELKSGITNIQRYQRSRSVTITAYPQAGFNTGVLSDQILSKLEAMKLPKGYRLIVAGEAKTSADSFDGMGAAALIAVFGILAVLILEFGSFKSTLVVAGVIPLGIMGGLLALFFSGYSISFTAMVGFIALIGIEIKNSILLVDFTNQLREQGVPLKDAVEQAGEVRFLPIILTSLTAIGGLLPLALQNAALYSPMAWVIIGGLISSTFLARLVTPVMYLLLPPDLPSHTT